MWRISLSNLLIAGIFIYIGLWFLLDNLGFMDASLKIALISFIPYVLVIFGLWLMIRPFIKKGSVESDWLFGLFFLPYGALLLADHFGLISFSWSDGWKLWPMIIIYVGSTILFHNKRRI